MREERLYACGQTTLDHHVLRLNLRDLVGFLADRGREVLAIRAVLAALIVIPKLECEIHKEGGGALEVVLTAGSKARSVQWTNAEKSTINFTYSGGGISSSLSGSFG